MQGRYISRYLNAEPQILWWDLSDFIKVLFFIFFGVLADHPFIFLIIGVLFLKLSTKLTSAKEIGYQKHLAYHLGLYGLKNKVPQSRSKMKETYKRLIKAFGSKDGLIVISTVFSVLLVIVLLELIFLDKTVNSFMGIFAIFSVLVSVLLFKRKQQKGER